MFEAEVKAYLEKHGYRVLSPKVVLFDMDGVLYDSMPRHAKAWVKAMSEYGIKFEERDAYLTEGMKGIDTIRIYAFQQLGKRLSESEAQAIYDEKTRIFHQQKQPEIFDGVIDLMTKIRSEGIEIGIVTGSGQRPLIDHLLKDFGQYVAPEHIVTAYDVKKGKPAPDPYLKGLELAGNLHPWEGIVIENAPMGVRAGVAASIFTIAVNSGPLPNSSLEQEGANVVLESMRELCNKWPELIKNVTLSK